MKPKKTLYIVDDHQLVVDGLRSLLADQDQFEIVGYSHKPEQALTELDQLVVDILLTDISMPGMSGVELTRLVKKKFPKVNVLALSMFGERQVVKEMIDAGISGYLLKNTGKHELLEALQKIAEGGNYFGEDVTKELIKGFSNAEENTPLTNREIEIIRLIEREYSNKKIADLLFISERTVETHRKNIFRKTGTQSIVGLLKYAYDHRII